MKKTLKIISIIVLVLLLLGGGAFLTYHYYVDPSREYVDNLESTLPMDTILTKAQAQMDLEYLTKCLKDFHPAYIDGSDDLIQAVDTQYEIEIQNVKEENSVLEIWQAASRIAAKMQSGHCNVWVNASTKFISNWTKYKKYNLLKIDGVPVDDLYQTFLTMFSYEKGVESYAELTFNSRYLICEQYLRLIGIDTSDGVDFTFETEVGESTTHYEFVTIEQVTGNTNLANSDFVYYELNEDNSTGKFTLTACENNDIYLGVLEQFFAEVFDKDIKNIIVDLRHNGGGNSNVAIEFLKYIDINSFCISGGRDMRYGPFLIHGKESIITNPKKNNMFDGNLYVLTSTDTYSAAMNFAVAISDNKIGTVVGEIPGNLPTCYTDIRGKFQLKNSKLCFIIPWKKDYRPDTSKDDIPLIPDYEINQSEALNKVYELIEGDQ